LFDTALDAEVAQFMAEFKAMAAAATAPEDIWALEEVLADKRRELDGKYDYRYSRLLQVFGWLLREGRLSEQDLQGLSEDKLAYIRRMQSL
jgi:hypothetical protein